MLDAGHSAIQVCGMRGTGLENAKREGAANRARRLNRRTKQGLLRHAMEARVGNKLQEICRAWTQPKTTRPARVSSPLMPMPVPACPGPGRAPWHLAQKKGAQFLFLQI